MACVQKKVKEKSNGLLSQDMKPLDAQTIGRLDAAWSEMYSGMASKSVQSFTDSRFTAIHSFNVPLGGDWPGIQWMRELNFFLLSFLTGL